MMLDWFRFHLILPFWSDAMWRAPCVASLMPEGGMRFAALSCVT